MPTLLSAEQFANALRQFAGIPPDSVEEGVRLYKGAARGAERSLRSLPSLGFFSSQEERVAAFIAVCKQLDRQVEEEDITPDEAHMALFLMMASDKTFYKAMRSFTNYAYRFRNDVFAHTDSETADRYFKGMADSW